MSSGIRSTTVLAVCRNGNVIIAADGQDAPGSEVLKAKRP